MPYPFSVETLASMGMTNPRTGETISFEEWLNRRFAKAYEECDLDELAEIYGESE